MAVQLQRSQRSAAVPVLATSIPNLGQCCRNVGCEINLRQELFMALSYRTVDRLPNVL
ncbi:hypothetical protein [Nocardia noduli]|uniref:hypothetical protein n=1 Tax=Nocardia noduli TaxID=2815722 RepID=UPI001C24807F|nr:hypothetical protein [Nocardia noduli]